MAFSGTVSQTTFDTRKVIEHAIRQCKIPAQQITAEHIDIAKGQLHLMLSAWASDNVPLWCIEKTILPLYDGNSAVITPLGTVDVLNVNFRTISEVTSTDTTTSTEHEMYVSGGAAVTTIGILWSSTAVPIALERSDDDVTWTTVQTETPDATGGEWTWFDLDSVQTASYYRVRATSGNLALTRVYLGSNPAETPLGRINRDDWTSLPNKTFQSNRPAQFWFDRQARQPRIMVWPAPNSTAELGQVIAYRQRHIMDVGTLQQEVEVPQRWYDAVVTGLAARLVMELVEANVALSPALDARAEKAYYLAVNEERDNSPIRITPDLTAYTA